MTGKEKKKVAKGKFQRNLFFSWAGKGKRFKREKQANVVPVIPSGQGWRDMCKTGEIETEGRGVLLSPAPHLRLRESAS